MKITGTFLDEISHDIPHQNWGYKEWDRDFKCMKSIGIDTVIMIRCGWKHWMTYPSKFLKKEMGCFTPPDDLLKMFLELAGKYNIDFFFGLYDSHKYWGGGEYQKEIDISKKVIEEVWKEYGHYPAFKGWYLSWEVSRRTRGIIDIYAGAGKFCKDISGNLPTLISPGIQGAKAISQFVSQTSQDKKSCITPEEHEKEWDEIMAGLEGAVDIVAFQDGHIDFDEAEEFLCLNKELGDRHGLRSWTNTESFDRDMPIKFLPIKWEKLLLKLLAAEKAGMEKSITFEFSHFMSPNSSYPQAHGLFDRYCEYIKHGGIQ